MKAEIQSVREIREEDIEPLSDYWLHSSPAFMRAMGVDIKKIPVKEQWKEILMDQIRQPYKEKRSYCIIWELNGKAIGHSNINKIIFGEEAYMHLHIWHQEIRKKGLGTLFIKMTMPYFFKNYRLKKLYCEPYALNAAPNRTLEKIGFELVKRYTTIPGWLNFEQPVKLWMMSYEKFEEFY